MRNIGWAVLLGLALLASSASAQVSSSFVRQWGGGGSGNGQFHATHADAFSPLFRIYVADEANHRVQYFSMNGTYLGQFGQWGHGTNDIINPVGMAFQGDGTVYVVERDNDRLHYFTPNGAHLGLWGSTGTGDGQFNKPAAAAFAPDGTLYVTDRLNHRVQHFTATGGFLGKWGSIGSGNGQFNEPYGVAVSTDAVVYVSDSQNCRVQYFTAAGVYLGQWGSVGSGTGQFGNASIYNNGSAHLSIDARGYVYVADPNNSRIQIFTPGGGFVGQIGSSYGTGNGLFAFPNSVALAPGWQAYVADEVDDLIQQMTVVLGGQTNAEIVALNLAATGLVITVEAVPEKTYTVQRSTTLTNWTEVAVRNVPEGLFSVTDAVLQAGSPAFFRAVR